MSNYGSEDPRGSENPRSDNPQDNNQQNSGPQFPFGGGGGPKLPDLKPFGGWKFSLICILIFVIALSFFHSAFSRRVNPTIDFSEFKARIASGEIKRVELSDSFFTGFTSSAPLRQERPASGGFSPSPISPQTNVPIIVYRTVPMNDPELIKLMD